MARRSNNIDGTKNGTTNDEDSTYYRQNWSGTQIQKGIYLGGHRTSDSWKNKVSQYRVESTLSSPRKRCLWIFINLIAFSPRLSLGLDTFILYIIPGNSHIAGE